MNWKQILKQNFTQIDRLADFLELSAEQRLVLLNRPSFSLNLPLRLANKIQKGSLDDPLLKQFLPTIYENIREEKFTMDPVKDAQFRRESKLLHKYEGRVLLVCTSACAMHCRYCFHQNFDYERANKSFEKELAIIASDSSIHEVILSGGDPLSMSDEALGSLLKGIGEIDHVKRIRFHTRFPIGIPERIDDDFISLMMEVKQQVWFVIHTNHPKELDDDIFYHLRSLQRMGCVLLNQSVLLEGVNDDVHTLKELCERLVDNGIFPYYLHQLDPVQGASHFEVEEEKGKYLVQEISKFLPGYAVPKYVKEIAGEPDKTLLSYPNSGWSG